MTTPRSSTRPSRLATLALAGSILLTLGACDWNPFADREAEEARLAAEERAAAEAITAAEQAAEEARAEAEAAAERLAAAEKELAAQKAEQEERERRHQEQLALEQERARLAAEQAAARERERLLAERERLLAEREEAARREAERAAAEREQQAMAPGPTESERAAPPPEPDYVEATLRPGTILEIEFTETLSSQTARTGDRFTSRLARDIYTDDGILAVPAGAEVRGRVIDVVPLKRVGGQASISVEFTELVPPIGPPIGLKASFAELGEDRRKDKKKIIGAAVAGAILGRVIGGKGVGEVLAGAAVGAAAGTAAVAASADGKDAVIPAGETVGLVLEEVVTVTTEMTGVVDP